MYLEDLVSEMISEQKKTNTILEAMMSLKAVIEEAPAEEAPVVKKKRVSRKKKEAPAPEPVVEKEDDFGFEETAVEAEAEPETTGPQMTKDDVEDELRKLIKNKQGAKARQIFDSFSVSKLTDIKDDDLNAIYAQFKAANRE